MSNTTITALPPASGIDGAADWLAIDRTSLGATQKINRNTFLGVTGQPMDISSSQNVTNKTLDNTNTVTLKDTLFTLQDDGDTTKQARFQLSGITTATTRTYTLPNASSTIADISTAQTFTNKTLTAPVINDGSITGTTITTDAIIGQSASTSGTVYGLSISSSKISGASITAGTGSSTLMAANAIQANQLATNAITLGYVQITADVSTASTSYVQATGLTLTVTIPAGSRRVRISAKCGSAYNATGGDGVGLSIWSGTVGSGTQLDASEGVSATANYTLNLTPCAIQSPSAGSITYNVGIKAITGGTAHTNSQSTVPSYLLVEVI